jgi:hypothetical protein
MTSLFPIATYGENCDAENMFKQFFDQSKNHLAEQKCIKISISEIYKPEDHNMVYRWHMGDGKEETGLDVSHCYENYGKYTATLDALLPETEFISENEMEVDIVIKEPVNVNIKGSGFSTINHETNFSYALTPLLTYEVDQVFWQVGKEHFFCGEILKHQFNIPGQYPVKLLIRLKNMDGYFFISEQKIIEVEGFNIFGVEFENLFQEDEEQNPFLKDHIHLAFVNGTSQKTIQFDINSVDSLCLFLPAQQHYEMHIWQGNKYIKPVNFSTSEFSDSLYSFTKIRSAILEAISGKSYSLSPISFDLNSTSLDRNIKKILKSNAKKLHQLEGFKLTIGSYTHTGGALQVNLEYSDARSALVKEYLEDKLQNRVYFTIAQARNEKCLINTNYTTEGTQEEDERFNGKTYIKIAGIE